MPRRWRACPLVLRGHRRRRSRLAWPVGNILRCADHALDDRVDRLEVAWVGSENHRHFDRHAVLAAEQAGAEVVLDVTGEILGGVVGPAEITMPIFPREGWKADATRVGANQTYPNHNADLPA